MGDVALLVPVVRSALEQNPNLTITLVSNRAFEPFFYDLPNFEFYGVNPADYRGVSSLFKLYSKLNSYQHWDAVLDVHSVVRTWVLGAFFKLSGVKVVKIDKGRSEKKALVQPTNKVLKQLPHTTQRYVQVFNRAGISFTLITQRAIHAQPFSEGFTYNKAKPWVGIAPFSKHAQKEWPLSRVQALVEALATTGNYQVFLLGGGQGEKEKLDALAAPYKGVYSIVNQYSLAQEIALVQQLDALVTMDSFNMHLAALLGVKVVSVWGATHRFAGFGPLNANEKYIVEIPTAELPCRPCSVFGNKPCYRGDLACMQQISMEMVKEKLNFALST